VRLARAIFAALLVGLRGSQRERNPQSGIAFNSDDVKQLQGDDAANPGMLWVGQGESLWREAAGPENKSCASCHDDAAKSMRGVAARYPVYDASEKNLLNLEGRINQCRVERQHVEPLRYESEALLALTAYVAHQSQACLCIDRGSCARAFRRGTPEPRERRGALNLSCAQCHERVRAHAARRADQPGTKQRLPCYRFSGRQMAHCTPAASVRSSASRRVTPQTGPAGSRLYLAWRAQACRSKAPACVANTSSPRSTKFERASTPVISDSRGRSRCRRPRCDCTLVDRPVDIQHRALVVHQRLAAAPVDDANLPFDRIRGTGSSTAIRAADPRSVAARRCGRARQACAVALFRNCLRMSAS
jgi:sulfur-oxidizing protein SoxA